MKEIVNINLETSTAPEIKEVSNKEYITYGTENWANLYPQFLIDLYYNSSTQAAIINATAEMISGEALVIEDEEDRNLEARVKLENFINRANGNESLHEVIKKIAFDFKLQGAFALNIVWTKDRTEIAEIYHVPVEKVRAERPDEFGKVRAYYLSSDWANTRHNKPIRIPAFNVNDRTSPNQLMYSGLYSPNMNVYHTPDYVASNNWALCDQKIAEFHLNNVANSFSGSYMISFNNGVPTAEERYQIEESLKEKFTGSKSAGRFVLTFSDDKSRAPELMPLNTADLDKQYLALQELLVQNILTGHRVTSPMLMGIKSDTGLGNNADEINSAANFYLNTVVKPFQDHIVKELRKIFQVNNMDMPVNFVQLKPITTRFTNQDLMAVMTQDEIREELGLPPLDEEVVVKEDLAKVGSMITDGKELPLFDTIEEAEAEAKKIGCSGHHEHTQDGKTYYMPCENHEQIKETELDTFLASMEDIPADWELISEEVVDGEHQDFDYEKVINNIANEKLELATSTGRANPNARSSQDGLNKSGTEFYKVRYVYTNDNFLKNKTGTTRDFCSKMMEAKKIYRKEDILKMGNMAVNPGFGPYGANRYSIWFYKGGPQCQHFWLRRIYKAPPSQDGNVYYPDNVQDQEYIGYTQAKNEGFTAQKNDNLVAKPPKRMKNHGYINPR
ncbi:MAG: putative portal protein [Prokaryotic dsDNA virus sp.]|nr:MAG: putative portal protein [Prokaryotic dsDNA virus sp.]